MYFKGTGSYCMLEGYVMNNYYARFDTHSYQRGRETDFNARSMLNYNSQ